MENYKVRLYRNSSKESSQVSLSKRNTKSGGKTGQKMTGTGVSGTNLQRALFPAGRGRYAGKRSRYRHPRRLFLQGSCLSFGRRLWTRTEFLSGGVKFQNSAMARQAPPQHCTAASLMYLRLPGNDDVKRMAVKCQAAAITATPQRRCAARLVGIGSQFAPSQNVGVNCSEKQTTAQ